AAAETAVQAARIAALATRIAFEVRTLYTRIYAVDRERGFLTAAGELLDMLSATAGSRYASGGGEQEAILKAQLEVSRLGERLDDLAADRAVMVAELNRWLGTPGAAMAVIAELPATEGIAVEDGAASADVQVARAQVSLAERRLAAARLDLKPDFSPAAGLATRGPLGAVLTLRFGVELPFRRRAARNPGSAPPSRSWKWPGRSCSTRS
ncbi:MAG TPA: hypothetical protein VE078_05185, partial [Thermoanaerobaculia bacterium]|nr:hypothetical protein [Thermoanaerobaculia bacterium]